MRRATARAFRCARLASSRSLFQSPNEQIFFRRIIARSASTRQSSRLSIRPASTRLRSLSFAVLGGCGAAGAWYAYSGARAITPIETGILADQQRSASSSASFSQTTRRAVVVDDEQFYTGSIVGDGPIEKTIDGRQMVVEMLSPEQATEHLRKNEESHLIGRGKGVVRYDVVQVASNDPIEDDHSEAIVPHGSSEAPTSNSDWMFWGVYDGHSGWATSAKLRQVLINFVARELNDTFKGAVQDKMTSIPTPESIDIAIKKGFLRLDHEITNTNVERVLRQNTKALAAELLAPALSGSCALLSFYDSHTKLLRVACTGDSRAVLGRQGPDGKWAATALSVDQTGGTPSEVERLRREHPGEEFVVSSGRILGGLEPSRAFGDASYKWPREVIKRLQESYFARSPRNLYRTPPYVTAEPIITTTKIEPDKGDFVVMATDGLWEMLTNEEVVGLVGKWLEIQAKESGTGSRQSWLTGWFKSQDKLPIQQKGKGEKGGQRAPLRQDQWGITKDLQERFVVQDKNAATHLVRNALGGKDSDTVCSLLTLPSPFSRRYRDDLTVEVIFFGEGEKPTGKVTLNLEASASAKPIQAKL